MRVFRPPLLAAAVLALLFPSAAARGQRPFRFDELARVERLGSFSLSPDGKWLAYAVTTADVEENRTRSAIWRKPVGGGEARRLTSGERRDTAPAFSPDGRTLAFLSDREGSAQIWTLDLAGGEPRRATSFPTEVNGFQWSPDGKWFVFTSDVFPECEDAGCLEKRVKERENSKIKARIAERLLFRHWTAWKDGRRTHIWKIPVAGGEAVDLTPGDRDAPPFGADDDFQVSPDGRWLLYSSNPDRVEAASTNGDVWMVPFDGKGEPRDLTAENKAFDGRARFSPDGKWIAYRAQKRPGFESDRFRLMLIELSTGKTRGLTEGFDYWVERFSWAPDSKSITFTSHVAAHGVLYRIALAGGAPKEIWKGGDPSDLQVSRDGRRLYFAASFLARPADIWSLGSGGERPFSETRLNEKLLSETGRGAISERSIESADGRRLQGWLVLPPGFDPSKKYPAVFLIHGGPQGAWTDSWSYRWNPEVWAGYGYVVYAANPRGSTGFGQRFVDEISRDWGGKVYDDLMRQADDLESLPYVDRARIGAAGASFGGYMIAWIAGHTNRFKVLVCHDGVADTPAMALSTEELWFPFWEFGGWPWTSDLYEKWNPMRFAGRFQTPTLVVTNERDFRVPFEQGLEFFTALQLQGVPSKLLMFPDEGHFVLGPGNSRLWHNVVMDWLHRYLGGAEADPKALATAYSVTR